ncbi:MAG TPA: vitamin K epoxide reductase family protein [Flavobacterium sp.]|uniref:vitamin K epoxide reductase family protein n=1 Tax=Flavobacterium sp. TaxID=239 RepID=UPI002C3953C8|nr:vitamin K epoxide reductase family protein [Flavobacterium sp.]HSD14692.1 vitamin K epoxide reductase family protein [Flavobacterium sp.]
MINVVKKYLVKNNYSEQKEDFGSFFLSHPNYPSVFAITDSLDALSIPNEAIKVPKEQFVELPEYFLTLLNDEMVLAQKKDICVTIEFENGKKKDLTFNEFLTDWDQIVIAIEPNEIIEIRKESLNIKWLRFLLPTVVLLSISLVYKEYNVGSLTLLFTSLIGLVVSVFILRERFGYMNTGVSKICSIKTNTSCNSVINSNFGTKWIQLSDLPFLFFGISVMAIAIQPKDSATIVGLFSVFSLPILLYSIWLQKIELKKWCVLCLAISFLMVTQVLIFVFENESFPVLFSIRFFEFLFTAFLFTSIWMLIKPVFEAKSIADKAIVESVKLKRNFSLYNFLSKEIPMIESFEQLEGLSFGDKNAAVQLTVIISPSCGHCHKIFEDAFKMVAKFPQRVFLSVLFNINTENDENPYKVVVENLLAMSASSPEKATEAIVDWHINKMGLDEWKAKWASNIIDMKVKHQIYQQYQWCLENGFNYTPVKIVNGKLFPEGYEISDLKYFLNEFSQERHAMDETILVIA